MKRREILEFLEEYSVPIGFGGWAIKIIELDKKDKDLLARIDVLEYNKELIVELPRTFYKFVEGKQKNILLHELIHGRVLLKQIRTSKVVEYEEELMVNDITNLAEL